MANTRVALLRYIKTSAGWRRYRVHVNHRGRGWQERIDVPQGHLVLEKGDYQLRWYHRDHPLYKSVGKDLQEAVTARDHQIANLAAEKAAAAARRKLVSEGPSRVLLADAKSRFIEKKRLVGRDKETVSAYENIIAEFLSGCGQTFADQVEEIDLLRFCDGLRKRGLRERTVMNYYGLISTFLRSCGLDHKTIVPKEHRPHKEDPEPEAYTEEEVEQFLSAVNNERDRLFFEFLLKTGARENEATHAEWSDINWRENVITIQGEKIVKVRANGRQKTIRFRTKTRRSRDITLEAVLLDKLKAWRKQNPKARFIFGTSSDLPNGHYLEVCKETARRAGLNCGQCESCLERKECERFYLHKFRASFATWSLQGGVDIRTVQKLMGHTKLEMTARYLAPAKGKAAQEKLNAVFLGVGLGALPDLASA